MVITTSINTFISRAGGKIEKTPYKAPELCFDLMEMVGKQVQLFRIKHEHQKKMFPVFESIKQTGGWNNWHKNYDEELRCLETPPMAWLVEPWGEGCYTMGQWRVGISWENVLENEPWWLFELFEAEEVYYQ